MGLVPPVNSTAQPSFRGDRVRYPNWIGVVELSPVSSKTAIPGKR